MHRVHSRRGPRPGSPTAPSRRARRDRWREYFLAAPTPMWEEDFSLVKERLDGLSAAGVEDFEAYFGSRPEELRSLADSVRVLEANDAVVDLLRAPDRSVLLGGLSIGFDEESYSTFCEELSRIARGERRFELEIDVVDFTGKRLRLILQWMAAPGSEERLDRVYVSAVDITARAEAEGELRRSLAEKDALLREIHHRVRNNLAIVGSLLGLQSGCSDGKVAEALAQAEKRIDAMAIVHDALYLSEDFARVSLEDCVAAVARGAFQREGLPASLRLETRVDDSTLPIEKAVACGILVHELVSNSLEHAFPQGRGGCVRLEAGTRPDGTIGLLVADDGVGLPPGVAPQTLDSLGFTLVRLLAGQLGGSLAAVGGPDGGLGLSIRFPA